jgi:hypothetical protein
VTAYHLKLTVHSVVPTVKGAATVSTLPLTPFARELRLIPFFFDEVRRFFANKTSYRSHSHPLTIIPSVAIGVGALSDTKVKNSSTATTVSLTLFERESHSIQFFFDELRSINANAMRCRLHSRPSCSVHTVVSPGSPLSGANCQRSCYSEHTATHTFRKRVAFDPILFRRCASQFCE